jgi:hypothetical protein
MTLDHGARDAARAARILHWAREKLAHRHPRFSQPALLTLVGRLLARFPSLRAPGEQPVVYRRLTSMQEQRI